MEPPLRPLDAFARDRRGNLVLAIALAAPIVLGIAGVSVDYAGWTVQRTQLQTLADNAALTAAAELQIGADEAQVDALVTRIVAESPLAEEAPIETASTIVGENAGVRVALARPREARFLAGLVLDAPGDIGVTAKAMTQGTLMLCVLSIDGSAPGSIDLDVRAALEARDCSVHANSRSPSAIRAGADARIEALRTCSGGGYAPVGPRNFDPRPHVDCPPADAPADCTPTSAKRSWSTCWRASRSGRWRQTCPPSAPTQTSARSIRAAASLTRASPSSLGWM